MEEGPEEDRPALRRYEDIRGLIGSLEDPTPLVRLGRVLPRTVCGYLKLEWFNPFGSVKDRTARALIQGMQERGELDGRELVEPTSGNTGIALAALAVLMDIPIRVTVPEEVPEEKKVILRMLGAEVLEAPDDLCPADHPRDGAIALARSLAESPATRDRYAMPDQYNNPDNVRAHYETTGPEIWKQTEGKVRTIVAGYGTCGTITGIGRFLKEQDRGIRIVAVEPEAGHRIPGLKNMEESRTPSILDPSVVDDVVRVPDRPAYEMTKRLFRQETLIVGPSTGAVVAAMAGLTGSDGIVVGISPDAGFKYASLFARMTDGSPVPRPWA
ncbi:MAG: cysteine synthase family protein [bacterium]